MLFIFGSRIDDHRHTGGVTDFRKAAKQHLPVFHHVVRDHVETAGRLLRKRRLELVVEHVGRLANRHESRSGEFRRLANRRAVVAQMADLHDRLAFLPWPLRQKLGPARVHAGDRCGNAKRDAGGGGRGDEACFCARGLGNGSVRWSRFPGQGHKVDLPMKRTIQHEDTQTVYGRVQGQGRA